jgi:hypothetical protein
MLASYCGLNGRFGVPMIRSADYHRFDTSVRQKLSIVSKDSHPGRRDTLISIAVLHKLFSERGSLRVHVTDGNHTSLVRELHHARQIVVP